MKNQLLGVLICVGSILTAPVFAQTSGIQKSSVTKERNGQKFLVHTVKKGETLFAISKAYNCTSAEIEKNNPTVKGSVNEGMELFVPIITSGASNTMSQAKPSEYKQHTVTKGQSLYAISKLYSVSMQDLIAANPDVKQGVEAGQIVKIPQGTNTAAASPTVSSASSRTHKVEKGQTVYSISKQYGITPDELKAANPSLADGLKLGSELIIPAKGKSGGEPSSTVSVTPAVQQPAPTAQANQEPGIHAVAKGETAFAIAKKYGTTVDELNTLNPGLKDGLKVGMVLQIPVKQKEVPSAVLSKKTTTHTVVAGETFFGIAQHYEISTADLSLLNPEIKDGKLTLGSVIKVPELEAAPSTPATATTDVKQEPRLCCDSMCSPQNKLNIALCLPLYLKANDTADLAGETMVKKEERLYPKSVPYIEFYEGLLMGLDSLKKRGVSVTLSVFDTQMDTSRGASIVEKLQSQPIDMIICIDDDAFLTLSQYAQGKQIPIVHPLSTNTQYVLNNPYSLIINTPQPYRIELMSLYSSKLADANIVVVNNNHLQELDFTEMYKSILGADTTRFHAVTYHKRGIRGVEAVLESSKKNVVIIPSEDQAFVNDIVTRLYQQAKKYDIDLQGLAVWETYKNIELDYLFDMHFSFATSNNRNYSDTLVRRFVLDYRSHFHTEPARLSFLGYDVILYLGQAMQRYGSQFMSCCNRFEWDGLQTRFSMQRISDRGGLVNSGAYIIRYSADDFTRSEQKFDIKHERAEYLQRNSKPTTTAPLLKPVSTGASSVE